MAFSLEKIRLFLLDLDGTFYLDDTLLPGALAFLERCRERGRAFAFLTNNSSRGKGDYLEKLRRLGVEGLTEREVFTSADATLMYLEERGMGRELLLVGTPSLERQFAEAGYDLAARAPKAVVLGFDTTLTYQKLTALCDAVRGGLPYIATHPDFNCPTETGFAPDIGAIIAFIEASAGRRPDVILGKPYQGIVQEALQVTGLPKESLAMVGDRLYTDVATGVNFGMTSILVLSGETTPEMLAASDIHPSAVFGRLSDMIPYL